MASDRQRLLDFARRLLGSREDAEDAVQETYVRALSGSRPELGQPAWMHTVLRNVAIDGLRRRKLERAQSEATAEPAIEVLDLESECEVALHHLLGRVSALEAAVMLLRDVFEFDFDEIAPIVGKSEAAIRQLLHRARVRSRRAEPDAEVDEYQVALCLRALEMRDPEPLLGLLERTTACAVVAMIPPTGSGTRAGTRLVQVNGRYALALVLNDVVLCIVPVGISSALTESARAE
jgi:RNA polymerase sigma-70 factor (ECF subfamily)